MKALAGLLLCAARVAHAQAPAQSPATRPPSGLAANAAGDAAAHRGFLPGGWVAPAGSVSFDVQTIAIPVLGLASIRASVLDRVEVVVGAAWAEFSFLPEGETITGTGVAVRVQVVRAERAAVAALAGYGGVSQPYGRVRRRVAAGVAASFCLDGARCAWTGGVHASVVRRVYRDEFDQERTDLVGAATVIAGRRTRAVAEVVSYVGFGPQYEVEPDTGVYLGVRFARRSVSVDVGALTSLSPIWYPVPLAGLTGRF
jgi:hypothetical protein